MVQLDGDAPDDLAPYSYHGSVGFGDSKPSEKPDEDEKSDEAVPVEELTDAQIFDLAPWELPQHDLTPEQIAAYIDAHDYDLDDISAFCDPEELGDIAGAMIPHSIEDLDDTLSGGDPEDVYELLLTSPELQGAFIGMGVDGFDDEVEAFTLADGLSNFFGKDYRVFFGEDGKFYVTDDVANLHGVKLKESGNENSGDHGHAGRPGQRGGSAKGDRVEGAIVSANFGPDGATIKPATNGNFTIALSDGGFKETLTDEVKQNEKLAGTSVILATGRVLDENGNQVAPGTLGLTLSSEYGNTVVVINTAAAEHDYNTPYFQSASPADMNTVPAKYADGVDSYMRLLTDHEMGHAFMLTLSKADRSDFIGRWSAHMGSKGPPEVSRYAATDFREGFAETYTAYVNHFDLDKPYTEFFDRVLHSKRLHESAADPDEPVAICCGFGSAPTTYIYADGHKETIAAPNLREVGGPGSGDFGHADVKGKRGGSAPAVDLPMREIPRIFKPEIDKIAATVEAQDFDGTLYHAMENTEHAHAIVNGTQKFYNSQTGVYGPGLYFATGTSGSAGASNYGDENFEVHVAAHLAVMSDAQYKESVGRLQVALGGFSLTDTEIAQAALSDGLHNAGFDGIKITDPYGEPGAVQYVADLNPGKTIKGLQLHEAAASAPIVVLFDDSCIATKSAYYDRPFED